MGVASGSSPLTQVDLIGTGNFEIDYSLPKSKWLRCVNGSRQSGLASINLSLTFISDDPQAINLAMSNALGDSQDQPPRGLQYSLLLWDAINTSGSSIWIPQCEPIVDWKLIRSKKQQTEIPLKFFWQQRNINVQLYFKRANAALITLLGTQSPF